MDTLTSAAGRGFVGTPKTATPSSQLSACFWRTWDNREQDKIQRGMAGFCFLMIDSRARRGARPAEAVIDIQDHLQRGSTK